MIKITGILACDPTGVVGLKNGLPWNFPEETAHFRKVTKGQTIVMGRTSYAGFPESLLKHRQAFVVTRSVNYITRISPMLAFIPSVETILTLDNLEGEVYMVGGGQLTDYCLDHGLLDAFILTLMHDTYEGDARFGLDKMDAWPREVILSHPSYTIHNMINPLKPC
jgi:dihydrofolate reductase